MVSYAIDTESCGFGRAFRVLRGSCEFSLQTIAWITHDYR